MPGEGWKAALELADYDLYKAKAAGQNCWYGHAAKPDITEEQLTMMPDNIEPIIESGVLQQTNSQSSVC